MRNKLIRFILIAVTALFIFFQLTSCKTNDTNNNTTDGTDTSQNATDTASSDTIQETTVPGYTLSIPEGTDYGGADFTFYVYDNSNSVWYDMDFSAMEETGEIINDAALRRMQQTEAILNVNIKAAPIGNYYGTDTKLITSIKAGTGQYDAAMLNARSASVLVLGDYLADLYSLPGFDITAPWWDKNAVDDLTINNKLQMITGDISVMYKKSIEILLFNKQLLQQYSLDDPYKLVAENKWTLDRVYDMVKATAQDLNGNGKVDADDRFGFLCFNDTMGAMLIGSGVTFISRGEDGYPELTFFNDRTVTAFNKIADIMYDPAVANNWQTSKITDNDALFMAGQSMLDNAEFQTVETMRQMDTDFGILPMPLLDETQDSYHHTINPYVAAMVTVPADITNPERTANVLDALGYYSKQVLTPAYYEKTLKQKGARDDESEAMIDLIFNTVHYDLGYVYNWGNIDQLALNLAQKSDRNITSAYDKAEPKINTAIEKAIDQFKGIS
ncbi:MAG: hypothetical protein FWD71_18885 [Oscillospiraceae bacterium]|nr:hypothetical protein [Oscillospiraceae bacterium]